MLAPVFEVHALDIHPLMGILYFTYVMGAVLKVISFAHVHAHIRRAARKAWDKESSTTAANGKENDVQKDLGDEVLSEENWEIIKKFKSNISDIAKVKDALYLAMVPTMCF